MYRDVLYAGFAGVKTGHEKITIFNGTHYFDSLISSLLRPMVIAITAIRTAMP